MPDGLTEDLNLGPAPQQQAPTNVLGTLGSLAEIQNKFNQNRLFQQTFQARQKLGQIIASAPDPESGWTAAMQDPDVAPFAGEAFTNYRQAQVAMQQYANAKQEGSTSGLKFALNALSGAVADPTQLQSQAKAFLSALPEENRAVVAPAMQSLMESLTGGLPKDPTMARSTLNQRMIALGIGSGVMNSGTPEAVFGKPYSQNQGGTIGSGIQLPPQAGGAQIPTGSQPVTLAPQLTEPGKSLAGGAAGLGAPAAAPVPNPVGGGPTAGTVGASGIPLDTTTATGKPLFPPGVSLKAPTAPNATGGLSALQYSGAQDLQKDFATKGLEQFQAAQQTKGQLGYITDAVDSAAKAGGLLAPGSLNGLRSNLAKLANTVSAVTGKDPVEPPEVLGKIEDAQKVTNWLGFNLVHQFQGEQREAAQTIQTGISSVPGLNNTPLGAHLMADSIGAMSDNIIDKRKFMQEYAAQNGGNLTGAEEKFNQLNPATDYTNAVLQKYGMTPQGFESPDAVKAAVQKGLLTTAQAKSALLSQFPDRFH